jgi:hypothetical protein
MPDFSKSFVVTTDASDLGLGAVLEQDGRPVAYESRKFNAAELNYTVNEKELLAVVHAMRIWLCYLESGTSFLVRTDHNPNVFFQSKPSLSHREARLNDCLQQFNFQWEYVKGVSNVVADPGLACLLVVSRLACHLSSLVLTALYLLQMSPLLLSLFVRPMSFLRWMPRVPHPHWWT